MKLTHNKTTLALRTYVKNLIHHIFIKATLGNF